MAQMIWEVVESFHKIPKLPGDVINPSLGEDPFAFCSLAEAAYYEQEQEARETLAKNCSRATFDGNVLHVSAFSLMKGEGEIIEDDPEPGARNYDVPEGTSVDAAPFDEESMRILEERGIDEEFLMW